MNKVQLEGRLGRDPETKFTASATQITTVSLATSNDYKDKATGQYVKKPASWHSIVCFGDVAKALAEYRKGDIIHAEGKIQYEDWTDAEGKKRTGTKIICFSVELKTT
ncbi:MAG: hypothetical protein CVU54_09695 [Deltaproteobacteria bacterium HGW-Deltaproteobacteria-12]|jgi:single-strand DNA-binding protein|nr:MAG: hypothetical protein CVU54_09695 [Deltaproteobacteria bacterium HGW-Deltaproteobacteria-12]